jgi:hypothetical protein
VSVNIAALIRHSIARFPLIVAIISLSSLQFSALREILVSARADSCKIIQNGTHDNPAKDEAICYLLSAIIAIGTDFAAK